MNTIRPIAWEVWLANVRFEDAPETKKRPVVVTETGEAFIIALRQAMNRAMHGANMR